MLREVECVVEKKGFFMLVNLEIIFVYFVLRKLRFVIEVKKEIF